MPLRRTTLRAVIIRAINNKNFLNALLKNPQKALTKAGLMLSANDLKRLRALFKSRKALTGKQFLRIINIVKGTPPPPPQWKLYKIRIPK